MELKGSKTEKNLMTAFAGESQARNKYTFYASKAKKEEIFFCSSGVGMLKDPLSTTFQSALGILEPLDWFAKSINNLVWTILYKKSFEIFFPFNTQISDEHTPSKGAWRYFF